MPTGLRGDVWAQVVRLNYQRGDAYGEHDHGFAEVFWIESGIAEHRVNGVKQPLRAGSVVFVRPSDVHAFDAGVGPFVMVNVAFRQGALDHLEHRYRSSTRSWPWNGKLPLVAVLPPRDIMRLQDWADLLANDPSLVVLDGFLLDLLCLLSRHDRGVYAPPWLARAVERFAAGEGMGEGASALHRLAGRSVAHVNREVRRHFGITATDMATALRLTHAARQLKSSDRPIYAIAQECGYASIAHFYREFLRRFSKTPLALRNDRNAIPVVGNIMVGDTASVRVDRPTYQ